MINQVSPFQLQSIGQSHGAAPHSNIQSTKTSFADMLKSSIEEVNQSQAESDKLTNALAQGQNVNLDEVMIAAQKSNITLTAATEFRNKAIEAYQEMMRMQM
ncbi:MULTISPECIES: flagellar hook-basal body complex protein FliE [Bacillus]|uniref:Flagellar hook-basal body complex protein FliE n=2 Tax=Bacillus TaxID=1386 RepID=A0A0M4G7M0_9BACI|nr:MULTISPECIES: flagellar hook-basal body complex protein FliE [Bacillus]ALC81053.1 flagellar hook-basal body protein FliE [Bacillus gobiensis]MBP1080012.1 flagellar hook-basal body complex protein FliE [Bacillus capparidis]MED1095400.1 flagellar hook-basal body complex protein FliE [Bacillus capparidis]